MTLQRALAYLDKLPPAISGSGGHNATLRAACECVRFGLSEGEAWQALQWFNAHRCQPAWSEKELRHKLADAQKIVAASGQAGVRAARSMHRKTVQQWRPPTAPASLRLTFANKIARPAGAGVARPGGDVARPSAELPDQPAPVARPECYDIATQESPYPPLAPAVLAEHMAALPKLPDRAARDFERVTRILAGDEVAAQARLGRPANVIRQTSLADGRVLVTWHRPKGGQVAIPGEVARPDSERANVSEGKQ
jgi:hypothetical protein